MNKIYNNLSIENLIKTEWFNQFDEEQQTEILFGIESDVDVLVYAKTEFNEYQMREIRLGLEDNLDVSVYAKTEISWREMEQIRKKLENEQNT